MLATALALDAFTPLRPPAVRAIVIAVSGVAAVLWATTGFEAQTEQVMYGEKARRAAVVRDHLSDENLKTKAVPVFAKAGTTSIDVSTNGQ